MAISVTNIGTATNGSSLASYAVAVPIGGVPSAAMVAVCVSESNNTIGGSVTDDAAQTYTATTGALGAGTTGNGFGRMFYVFNSAALTSGQNITYTGQGSDASALSAIYATGVLIGSDPLDTAVTQRATGTSNAPSVTSGTPAVSGELFLAFLHNKATSTYNQDTTHSWATPPNASTMSNAAVRGGNQVNAGTGTITFSPTLGTSVAWAAFVFGFKPATGVNSKAIAVSQAQSASVHRSAQKNVAVTSAQNLALVRSVSKSISVLSASVVAAFKGVAHVIPAMSQGQSVGLTRKAGKTAAITSSQSVGLIARLSHPILIALTNAQTIALQKLIGKNVVTQSAQSVSLTRAMSHAISFTTGLLANLVKTPGKPIGVTGMGQTVLLQRSVGKIAAVLSSQAITVSRLIGKNIAVLSAQLVKVPRGIAHSISVLQDQTVLLVKQKRGLIQITQGQTVALQRTPGKILKVTSAQTVKLVRTTGKNVSVLSGQSVKVVRRVVRQVVIGLAGLGQIVVVVAQSIMASSPRQVLKNVVRRLFILGS